MFRRLVFNVVVRNQDDHTKNISFLMGRDGRISPGTVESLRNTKRKMRKKKRAAAC